MSYKSIEFVADCFRASVNALQRVALSAQLLTTLEDLNLLINQNGLKCVSKTLIIKISAEV